MEDNGPTILLSNGTWVNPLTFMLGPINADGTLDVQPGAINTIADAMETECWVDSLVPWEKKILKDLLKEQNQTPRNHGRWEFRQTKKGN